MFNHNIKLLYWNIVLNSIMTVIKSSKEEKRRKRIKLLPRDVSREAGEENPWTISGHRRHNFHPILLFIFVPFYTAQKALLNNVNYSSVRCLFRSQG